MNFNAVILAGGQSSRMGRDKAFLEIEGRTLLARQIGLAQEAGAEGVFVSGRPEMDYSAHGCPVLKDKFENAGPLAGIERALAAMSSSLLLVLAVDLPGMETGFLRQLLAMCEDRTGVIPCIGGQVEPLAAFYPREAGTLVEVMLRDGDLMATAFAQRCVQSGFALLREFSAADRKYFVNWNSPVDLPN